MPKRLSPKLIELRNKVLGEVGDDWGAAAEFAASLFEELGDEFLTAAIRALIYEEWGLARDIMAFIKKLAEAPTRGPVDLPPELQAEWNTLTSRLIAGAEEWREEEGR